LTELLGVGFRNAQLEKLAPLAQEGGICGGHQLPEGRALTTLEGVPAGPLIWLVLETFGVLESELIQREET
jgi:hypothetical protein